MSILAPLECPIRQSIERECKLTRELLGIALNSLGKAFYDYQAQYYVFLFGLSIGIERLCKLILFIDSYIQEKDQTSIKNYGHNIKKLISSMVEVRDRNDLKLKYFDYDDDAICVSIIENINYFAQASGRYANLDILDNKNLDRFEPTKKWHYEIDEVILQKHYKPYKPYNYTGKDITLIRDIDGKFMSLEEMLTRVPYRKLLFRYRKYYTMIILRKIMEIFIRLSDNNYNHPKVALGCLNEFFSEYCGDNDHLKYLSKLNKFPVIKA